MRLLVLIFTFGVILNSSTLGQEDTPQFMDNKLIIKFENSYDAEKYKSRAIPQASFFSLHNIGRMRSIWKDEFTTKMANNLLSKGKAANLSGFEHLKNIYEVGYRSNIDPITLAKKISTLPGIEYAEPRYIYKTHEITTNDPIQNETIDFHSFDKAWEINKSSSDIVIAIVDSGVNYTHEDLKDKHWINTDEIPNNGIDDDSNGWIDDFLGWDFWDATAEDGSFIEDNDPFASNSFHGTHVAGIATATPNNNVGLTGTGFNARFMAVKAGGAPDDPLTFLVDESELVGAGYEGILYAVINGADIVNCSWGGFGYSAFGEDIVNMAHAAGVLVVSSAGNSSTDRRGYPDGFESVLSVGALSTSGAQIAEYSNFGTHVDVFATGTIESTFSNTTSGYRTLLGTSMASPVVAGLAALIKSEYQNWTPDQIKAQIRSSSESIEENHDDRFEFKLGKGSINAERALRAPLQGIKVDAASLVSRSGGRLDLNDEGTLMLFLKNYGSIANSIVLDVENLTGNVELGLNTVSVGSIGNNETKIVEIPIILRDIPSSRAELLIQFSDNSTGYSDFDVVDYSEQLRFDVTDANNLALSFSPNGNIGFFDYASDLVGGIGFVPDHQTADFNDDNLMFEGGLLFEANQKLANAVRTQDGGKDRDFRPISIYSVTFPDIVSQEDGRTIFSPKEHTNLQDAVITLKTFAFTEPSVENSIILNYNIENTSNTLSLADVYLGIFNDWDIGDFTDNSTSYNSENDVLIIREEGESDHPFVALATFANTSSVLAIDNGFDGQETDFEFNIFDGYSSREKRNSLKSGTSNTTVSQTDVSTVVATGPYFIEPKSSISLGFAYAFGDTEQELIDQINAARASNIFEVSDLNMDTKNGFPKATELFQNYPNPFNPTTSITFNLSETLDVNLSIYNILGKKVHTVINDRLEGGIHEYPISLNELSSGIYFAVLDTPFTKEVTKLALIK